MEAIILEWNSPDPRRYRSPIVSTAFSEEAELCSLDSNRCLIVRSLFEPGKAAVLVSKNVKRIWSKLNDLYFLEADGNIKVFNHKTVEPVIFPTVCQCNTLFFIDNELFALTNNAVVSVKQSASIPPYRAFAITPTYTSTAILVLLKSDEQLAVIALPSVSTIACQARRGPALLRFLCDSLQCFA
jgi:hypothetical protein